MWFKGMIEEYVRLKKQDAFEGKVSDTIAKIMGIKKKGDMELQITKKMIQHDSLEKIALLVQQYFKLEWVQSYDELYKYLMVELKKKIRVV